MRDTDRGRAELNHGCAVYSAKVEETWKTTLALSLLTADEPWGVVMTEHGLHTVVPEKWHPWHLGVSNQP